MEEKKEKLPEAAAEEKRGESELQKRTARLYAQADELKKSYPKFELKTELKSPMFVALLRAGADMRTAYEFVHRDELLGALIGEVAQGVRERVLNDVRSRGARPCENGTGGRAPAIVREPLPSEWSREERERIGREALRGKKHSISL